MAVRPIFLPGTDASAPVRKVNIDFLWHSGLSIAQKQRSIRAMHEAAHQQLDLNRILEISSKSLDREGIDLSAFNLRVRMPDRAAITIENAFQSSKVFENGGPFSDLLAVSAVEAKRDHRLKQSGKLLHFQFGDVVWPNEPLTAFYDWLYLTALSQHPNVAVATLQYDAFTDIEFNPNKSINCQAHSAALFVYLSREKILADVMSSQAKFLDFCSKIETPNTGRPDIVQGSLF